MDLYGSELPMALIDLMGFQLKIIFQKQGIQLPSVMTLFNHFMLTGKEICG